MTQIVITIKGGLVEHVAANAEIEYVVIDEDNIRKYGEGYPSAEEALSEDYFFEDLEEYLKENKPSDDH